jgi:2,4-dienoyl-CoA reductase (NADPH2)
MKAENDFHNEEPRPLKISEIEDLVDKFASAAVRAKKAGFDGVDINAASSHLLHNFLSPFWNRRTDIYGGSLENRARFVTQIVGEIKRRLGKDFPVDVIINGMEIGQVVGIENSKLLTQEDSRGIAKLLEKAGADSIHVRSHWLGFHVAAYLTDMLFYPEPPVPIKDFPKGYDASRMGAGANVPFAAGIKKEINIPVIVVGRMDAELGEKALSEGKVDFIGMTRRLQADPDYPKKIAEGRLDDIAPCTACANCLGSQRCRINAFLGKPYNTIEKAKKKKKVVVVGGGPGGMEAARVASLRGHEVTLFDKESKLGGLLHMAATIKGTKFEDLPAMIKYFAGQMTKLGVNLHLGKEAMPSDIVALKPDAVILATGGLATAPEIPGINKPIVLQRETLYGMLKFFLKFFSPEMLGWLSSFYLPFGMGKKVVIIGGGLQGCELAEFLTKKGKKVTIVDTEKALGYGLVDALMGKLFAWFKLKGVIMISGVKKYVEITDKGLIIINKEGNREFIEADNIIPVLPMVPNNGLVKSLKGKVREVYAVGDCNEPQLIADAIGTASVTAMKI